MANEKADAEGSVGEASSANDDGPASDQREHHPLFSCFFAPLRLCAFALKIRKIDAIPVGMAGGALTHATPETQ
jgi:hypothetical protein